MWDSNEGIGLITCYRCGKELLSGSHIETIKRILSGPVSATCKECKATVYVKDIIQSA